MVFSRLCGESPLISPFEVHVRLKEKIESIFTQAIQACFPELTELEQKSEVALTSSSQFGHFQCNSAMRLSKILKQPPRIISQAIVDKVKNEEIFEKVEVAGPGFINITLKPAFLSDCLMQTLRNPRLGFDLPKERKRILIDFSQPNIAKEMHVGHLRSTIIGDSLARLFEFLGYDVLRINHLGDWGTAFGMLIAYLKAEHPGVFSGNEEADLTALMNWYKASKKRFDEDENFKTTSRQCVVLLQGGDPEVYRAWEKIVAISKKAYQEIYSLLDVKLSDMGESFYNPYLPLVVADLEKKGLVTVSEGAKCVFIDGIKIPFMVQKSDGGYNYDTTDIAAMKYRIEEQKADRIIIVTDAGQSLHFKLVFETAVKAGYLDRKTVRFDHVPFGLVLGSDGKRFRTRSGDTEKLIDLLTAAILEAKRLLKEREPNLAEEEANQLASVLGINAIKYADLSSNRIKDYLFSYERMLRFEGNTSTFLLYSYVRVNGIKRKMGVKGMDETIQFGKIDLKHPSELDLAFHLLQLPEVIHTFEEELYPHVLTDYLFELAQKFNGFFRDCRVEGSKEEESRLLLCEATARVLRLGLEILGLKVVEKL